MSCGNGRELPIMSVDTKKVAGNPSDRMIGAAVFALSAYPSSKVIATSRSE